MQMQVVARGYLAYDLTGKNSALGAVMIAFGVPQLVLGLWGGVLADRLPKRNLLLVCQMIIALNSAWVATMIELDRIEFWMLVVAGFVQGAGFAFVDLFTPKSMNMLRIWVRVSGKEESPPVGRSITSSVSPLSETAYLLIFATAIWISI